MTAFRLQFRHSRGLIALPLTVGVLALHLALRSTQWRHEWLWALVQLNFVTIFMGPLAAALGAYEGSRWSGAALGPRSRASSGRTALGAWSTLCVWLLAPFAVGLVTVGAVTLANGTPWGPRPRDLLLPLAGALLIAGWAAIGLAIGWYARGSRMIVPLVLIGSFCITLLAYTSAPGHIVDVGGATASLVGLDHRPGLVASQVVLWTAVVAVGVLAVAARDMRLLWVVVAVALCIGAGTVLWQEESGTERLVAAGALVSCEGDPVVCLAPGYEQYRSGVDIAIAPTVDYLASIGVEPEVRITQDVSELDLVEGATYATWATLNGDQRDGAVTVLNALIPPSCSLMGGDPEASQAFSQLSQLVADTSTPLEVALRNADPVAVRQAVDALRSCSEQAPGGLG